MKFDWSGNPRELNDLPKAQRKAAKRFALQHGFGHWQFWVGVLLCALGGGGGTALGRALEPSIVGGAIGGGIGGFVGGFLLWQLLSPVLRPYYERYLTAIGHCRSCGYDLRGSPSGVCPECGAPNRDLDLFSGSEFPGNGVLHFTAADAWYTASDAERVSALNEAYTQWRAAMHRRGRPVAVYVRDAEGNPIMGQVDRQRRVHFSADDVEAGS